MRATAAIGSFFALVALFGAFGAASGNENAVAPGLAIMVIGLFLSCSALYTVLRREK